MNDWKNSPITKRANGSYVIAYAGFPEYHVPNNEEFGELWTQIEIYAQEHPEQIIHEPAPAEPTKEELLKHAKAVKTAEINALMADIDKKIVRSMSDLLSANLAPNVMTVDVDGSKSGENEEVEQSMVIFSNLRSAQSWNRTLLVSVQEAETVEAVNELKPISASEKIAEIMENVVE